MTIEQDISDLKEAREKIAGVYERQAVDNNPDNGNLSGMNTAIMGLGNVIIELEKKLPPEE